MTWQWQAIEQPVRGRTFWVVVLKHAAVEWAPQHDRDDCGDIIRHRSKKAALKRADELNRRDFP